MKASFSFWGCTTWEAHAAPGALVEPLRRLGCPPDPLGGVVDPLEAQDFRVVAQLAEGCRAGVALEAEGPEHLLESEGVGDAVCGYP